MRDVLQAVVYIHGQSVAHRDIKPDNILVCRSGLHDAHWLVKIADFGYAAYCERPGLTGGYGTVDYLAPEVMGWYLRQHCHPYGLSCDLWSLGSLGGESLSDVHPLADLQDKLGRLQRPVPPPPPHANGPPMPMPPPSRKKKHGPPC